VIGVKRVVRSGERTFTLHDGGRVGSSNGVVYRVRNMVRGGFTLERELPKVKGKAARRADKLARRRLRDAREHNARLELRRQDRQARAELEA